MVCKCKERKSKILWKKKRKHLAASCPEIPPLRGPWIDVPVSCMRFSEVTINPFTPSDQFQISPAASPEIQITQYEKLGFSQLTQMKDDYSTSSSHLYISLWNVGRIYSEVRSERLMTRLHHRKNMSGPDLISFENKKVYFWKAVRAYSPTHTHTHTHTHKNPTKIKTRRNLSGPEY